MVKLFALKSEVNKRLTTTLFIVNYKRRYKEWDNKFNN